MKWYNSLNFKPVHLAVLTRFQTRFQIRPLIQVGAILLLMFLSISSNPGFALDAEGQGSGAVSIHEVAMKIRQFKSWQILDASPRHQKSGVRYFRFKLLHSNGKVKIINIDPMNPNLRRLEK